MLSTWMIVSIVIIMISLVDGYTDCGKVIGIQEQFECMHPYCGRKMHENGTIEYACLKRKECLDAVKCTMLGKQHCAYVEEAKAFCQGNAEDYYKYRPEYDEIRPFDTCCTQVIDVNT